MVSVGIFITEESEIRDRAHENLAIRFDPCAIRIDVEQSSFAFEDFMAPILESQNEQLIRHRALPLFAAHECGPTQKGPAGHNLSGRYLTD
jgi:hypothetical protein